MVKKIALEEHFLDPAAEPYWRPTMVDVAPAKTAQLYAALTDFGEQRRVLPFRRPYRKARRIAGQEGHETSARFDESRRIDEPRKDRDPDRETLV